MKKKNTTRLGRAVRAAVDDGRDPMIGKEKHSTNNSLRDVILGGQDGLVNMLGIALGVLVRCRPVFDLQLIRIRERVDHSDRQVAGITFFAVLA